MNELIKMVNERVSEKMIELTAYAHTTPGEIVAVSLILAIVLFVNWFIRGPFRRWTKIAIFKRRRSILYRLLFHRIAKLVKPLRLLISLLLIKKALSIFFIDDSVDLIFFSAYWMLFLWWIYEVIKFLLYAGLSSKIKRQKNARMELFNLFLNITRVLIAFLLIIMILSHLGIDLTALITSLGIGGAIVGLSAKDTLVNFFDSIRLVSEDAFRQGEWIETRDVEGFVTEIGLTSTKIRTFDNAMVTIPNTKLVNDYLKNWSRRMVGRRIKFHLRLKFSDDTKEIERVLYEIYDMLHSHPDIVNDNKLRYLRHMKRTYETGLFNLDDKYGVRRTLLVYLDNIGEYSLDILIYAFSISVNWEEWLKTKEDVIMRIIRIIDESSLELAFPLQEVKLTGNESVKEMANDTVVS
jgi:MscS family membrane protein